MPGFSRWSVALTRTGRLGSAIGVVQSGFRRSRVFLARSRWTMVFFLISFSSTRGDLFAEGRSVPRLSASKGER